MARTTRETIIAVDGASTWHTAVALGANMGIYPDSLPNISLGGEPVLDTPIGLAEVENVDYLMHDTTPEVRGFLRRTGAQWHIISVVTGDDTVSGVGPYTHTMTWQTSSTLFSTMAMEVNNADIIEWPSVKWTGFTLESSGDGRVNLTARSIADTVQIAGDATNTGTEFDAVTYITNGLIVPARELQFRINAQAGGALGGSDEIDLSGFTLDVNRPYVRDDLSKGATDDTEKQTDEPVQEEVSDIRLSVTVNDYTTIALLDDLKDQTEYKATLVWARTISTVAYSLTIELGRLIPFPQDIAAESQSRLPLTRTFRCIKPTSTPTGLATANPIHIIMVDNSNISYETIS